jgi:DNA polymerase III alpha subunit (gram-positive type)
MTPPKVYDLKRGEYSVVVTVGKSSLTQRDANATMIQSVIEASGGQAAPFLLDIWAEQVDSPMGKKVAKRLKMANPALAAEDSGQPQVPPQIQAQMQQMQQQMQQQGQALQQAQQAVQMDSAKAQAQTQIEQMKAQAAGQQAQTDAAAKKAEIDSKERIAALNARVELAKVRATIQSKEALAVFEAENARLLAELEVQSEEQATIRGQMHEDRVREVEDTRAREASERATVTARESEIGKAALADLAASRKAPPARPAPKSPGIIDTLTPPAPTVSVGPSGATDDPRM